MASESKAIELVFKNSDDIDETKGILKTVVGADIKLYIFNKNIFEIIPNNGEIEQEIDEHGIEHHYTNSCLWISIRDFLNNIYYTGREKKTYTVSELRKMAGFMYPDNEFFDANKDHSKHLIKLLDMLNLCVCIFKPQMINKDVKVSSLDAATDDPLIVDDTQKPHLSNVIGPSTSYCSVEGRQIIPILNSGGDHFCVITNMPIKISATSRDSTLSEFKYISNNYFTFENALRYNYKGTKLNSESLSAEDKIGTIMSESEINEMFQKQELDNIINRNDRLIAGREKYMEANPGKKIIKTEQVLHYLNQDFENLLSSPIENSRKDEFIGNYVEAQEIITNHDLKIISAIQKIDPASENYDKIVDAVIIIDPASEHYNDIVDGVIFSLKFGGSKYKHKYFKYIHKISQL